MKIDGKIAVVEKPITARPVGNLFVALTRGYKDTNHRSRAAQERTYTSVNDGCFRRLPTCKE